MKTPRTLIAGLAVLGLTLTAAPASQANTTSYGEIFNLGAGRLEHPVGVAINQATGNVYASSFDSTDKLDEFNATGSPISPPSPFGNEEFFSGVAVDPVNSNLYAVTAVPPTQAIQTYNSATGELLSQFSVAGPGIFLGEYTVVQIASDAAGNIYFPHARENEIQEFSPQGSPLGTIAGSGASALKEPTGVALNAAGDIYVADSGDGRIEEFSPTGALLGSIPSPGVQALAIDPAGDIFAGELNSEDACGALPSPCDHVVLYNPAGAKLADFGAGTIGTSEFGSINTLAVGPNGWVYVADGGSNIVRVYAQQSEPSLLSLSSSAVTQTTAELIAKIDPNDANTTYHFEYGTSTAYGTSIPITETAIGDGLQGPAPAAQQLTGLQPDTTYHYRVVANNALGQTTSADQTFTTLPPEPPTVSTGQATAIAQNTATLTAAIETQGFETTYEFDLGTDASYGTRIFGDAGSEPGTQTFKVELQGLTPGATYHYRIAATNTFGTNYGTDQIFTTATYPSATLTPPTVAPLVPAPLLATAAATYTTSDAHAASIRPGTRQAQHSKAKQNTRRTDKPKHTHNDSKAHHTHGANTRRGK